MKIVITVSTYFPQKDGVSVVTTYLAEGLAKKGHEVMVYTAFRESKLSDELHNKVIIKRIEATTVHAIHKGNKAEYLSKLMHEVESADVLINVCTQCALTDWILPYVKDIKCKKILYMHGMVDFKFHKYNFDSLSALYSKIYNIIRWKLYYTLNCINFKSYDYIVQLHNKDTAYRYFEKRGFCNQLVIGNAVEDAFFETCKKSDLTKKMILNVNNFFAVKNQAMGLKVFYQLDIADQYQFVFIGSEKNKYYDYLVKLKEKYDGLFGFRDVIFLTGVDRKQIPQYIKSAVLYVMTSKSEIYPVSLLEAAACGTPIISTDVGIVKHFPFCKIVKNEKQLVEAMRAILLSGDLQKFYSMEGSSYAQKYFHVNQKVDLLEKLCKQGEE